MTSAPTTPRTVPRWSPALGGAVLCWGGAAFLVHRTAEIAVVDGVRAQLGTGGPGTSFGVLAVLAGGAVLLATGYAVLLVAGARPR
ncbi:hypothetical protein, partial [Actinotalea sp. C106]|uniref:hypothetical protein n=1 Tax=Actinotalea sp. C106 TaxID=2908644 RepID=UPI002027706D